MQDHTSSQEIVQNAEQLNVFNFGIGCFHFSPNKNFPDKMPVRAYSSELKRVLERIPSIGNLTIEEPYSRDYDDVFVRDEFDFLSDGYFTGGLFDEIFFLLSIPEHFIEHEGSWIGGIEPTVVSVHIKSEYYAPVAIVGYQTNVPINNGSNYIIAVREYLKFALGNTKDCPFDLDFVGPSPMHMDFSIIAAESQEILDHYHINRHIHIEKITGYDWMKIPVICSNDDYSENISRLIEKFCDDANIFYNISLKRVRLLEMYYEAQSNVAKMVNSAEKSNSLIFYPFSSNKSKLIQEAFVSTINLQIAESSIRFDLGNSVSSAKNKGGMISDYLSNELNELEKFPTEEFSKLIEFFESKNQHVGEITIASVSTIFGAIIGAVITYYLSS